MATVQPLETWVVPVAAVGGTLLVLFIAGGVVALALVLWKRRKLADDAKKAGGGSGAPSGTFTSIPNNPDDGRPVNVGDEEDQMVPVPGSHLRPPTASLRPTTAQRGRPQSARPRSARPNSARPQSAKPPAPFRIVASLEKVTPQAADLVVRHDDDDFDHPGEQEYRPAAPPVAGTVTTHPPSDPQHYRSDAGRDEDEDSVGMAEGQPSMIFESSL